MLFNQLNIGDKVYIIEVVGTFKKTTEYNEGSVTQVSSIYDEPLPPGQFPMPNQPRKKVVDITIQCNGGKRQQLNAMKKWLSAKYYQISWEQIMNQLERTIKYQNYRKKLVS